MCTVLGDIKWVYSVDIGCYNTWNISVTIDTEFQEYIRIHHLGLVKFNNSKYVEFTGDFGSLQTDYFKSTMIM